MELFGKRAFFAVLRSVKMGWNRQAWGLESETMISTAISICLRRILPTIPTVFITTMAKEISRTLPGLHALGSKQNTSVGGRVSLTSITMAFLTYSSPQAMC